MKQSTRVQRGEEPGESAVDWGTVVPVRSSAPQTD